MHPKESENIKEKTEELIHKAHNRKNLNFMIGLSLTQKGVDLWRNLIRSTR